MVIALNKFDEFIRIAQCLNSSFGITPVLYGSLGLQISSGINFDPDDIDILIPDVLLNEKWIVFKKEIETLGYLLIDLHEHEFIKDKLKIAFAKEEDLLGFAQVNYEKLAVVDNSGVKYKVLGLEEYLRVYERSLSDGYRRTKNNGKDIIKIDAIKSIIESVD